MKATNTIKTKHSLLTVFVHIPKTAGSTVNHHLQKSHLSGQDHIEQWLGNPQVAKDKIRYLDWVSGHISFPSMRSFLANCSPRHMLYFSIFRDPIKQITSHYNWLIEIFHKSEGFYNSHPENIKKISETIRNSANDEPLAIIENLKSFPGLFLNQQSRVLLGEDASQLSEEEILNRLQAYEFVATERTLDVLIERLTADASSVPSHENKSGYHFDPAVFQTPQMREFLSGHHKTDIFVYDILMRQGGCFPPAKPSEG